MNCLNQAAEEIAKTEARLLEVIGEAAEDSTLSEMVEILWSQRENARNATVATKLIMEKVLKRCLFYIPRDGTQERDLRETIEDLLGEEVK